MLYQLSYAPTARASPRPALFTLGPALSSCAEALSAVAERRERCGDQGGATLDGGTKRARRILLCKATERTERWPR
jgi:hypothetical protein